MSLEEIYPKSVEELRKVLGDENYKAIEQYLHAYNGEESSVKPIAKYITIYWIGRSADRMILRTEGEDDIILSRIGNEAVPTIIFRKLKAVYLREFMKLARSQWVKYSSTIKEKSGYDQNYDFLTACSIAVGIAGEGKGTLHGRCMKCPVDVLMGATTGKREIGYNLVSRFVGDSAYALSSSFERRTGNSVDEITYTTIMIREGMSEEEKRTGGLYPETFVEPNTIFVGKIVLNMISPPELLYVLWMLHRITRVGARTSIWGTLEVHPVALIGDFFEVGTALEAAEKLQGKRDLEEVKKGVIEYLEAEAKFATSSKVIVFTKDIVRRIKETNIFDESLAVELWKNANNYVKGLQEYLKKK